jgi:hypothetical protein
MKSIDKTNNARRRTGRSAIGKQPVALPSERLVEHLEQ